MQRYRSSLIVGFVVALIIQLRVAKLDKGFLDGLAANMRKSQKLKVDIPDTLAALGSCGIEKAHTVLSFLDAGSGGALFNVAENGPEDPRTHLPSLGNPYTAKIVLEDDNRFSICKREKLVDQLNEFVDVEDLNTEGKVVKFKERKVSYLNIITKYDQIVGTNNQRSVFACVLILEETKSDSTDVLFSKTSEGIKPNNSKKLLRFFGKVALSLAELHFKAHTLHGNVNPGCIMKKSIKGDTDIDPILTDFSRALINDSGKDLPDAQLRYEADYRPPEMTEKTKEGIQSAEKAWEKNWNKYNYSKDFLEDVYALGKTIKKVIEIQKNYIASSQCEYDALVDISDMMIRPITNDPTDIASGYVRPNMKRVLEIFIEKTEECGQGLDNRSHKEFISKARRSLKYIPKRIVII